MDRSTLSKFAAVALSAGVAAAFTLPSGATANPALDAAPDRAELADATMLDAIEQNLGLSADAALDRLADDLAASETEAQLRESLDSLGGAWIEGDELMVAVADPSEVAEVNAAGATPQLVTHTEAELSTVMADLDSAPTPDADEVYTWRVDAASNSVVVEAAPGAADAALAWVEESGVDAGVVEVETGTGAPEPLYDIVGGDPYYPGGSRCSIGFSVSGGFVTAGHCGSVGTRVSGYNRVSMGTVAGSSFPGRDMGFVSTNSNWTPRPWVYQYNGNNWVVNGSSEASTGATVCRSGSTTGVFCGSITAKNQSVNYPQGTVRGLTRTNVCAEPGDSGGSWVAAGINAQGVTSGGSGNCSFGGTTYFQPVNPILSAYGLSLTTG